MGFDPDADCDPDTEQEPTGDILARAGKGHEEPGRLPLSPASVSASVSPSESKTKGSMGLELELELDADPQCIRGLQPHRSPRR
jgi:hypothetical protein